MEPGRFVAFLHLCIAAHLVTASAISSRVPGDDRDCVADVVSATVIATVCTHVSRDHKMLDLLLMWRGAPNWYQRSENGGRTKEVVRDFARGERGRVAQFRTYAQVTIGFDADFDADTVTIDGAVVVLNDRNAILIDNVDVPHVRRVAKSFRVDPTLPLRGNMDLALARKSAEVKDALQCDVDVPSAKDSARLPARRPSRPASVCELLR
jgi:hypothetical protein